jgi:KTSC domain
MKGKTEAVHRRIVRQAVVPRAIRSIGYDVRTQVLEIEFTNESVYRYYDVPEDVYTRFMRPFFNAFIPEKYDFVRVR